jgi:hypothetical protein
LRLQLNDSEDMARNELGREEEPSCVLQLSETGITTVLKSVVRTRLRKTENPSVFVTVKYKVRRSAIAVVTCLVYKCHKSNHPIQIRSTVTSTRDSIFM